MDIVARIEKLQADLALGLHEAPADRRILLQSRPEAALAELAAQAALPDRSDLPLAGVVLTVKACIDMAGLVTDSASGATSGDTPAEHDAPVLARLRAAGAVVIGQANMTEFAYGALGLNHRFGTPRTPLDPSGERVAGGSTSGGAVAVANGLADLSLGSDTSGSARIPAAFCGCIGWKPGLSRYPREGLAFLSSSFDVPGLLARDMDLLLAADRAISGRDALAPPARLRLAVPAELAGPDIDADVGAAFEAALDRLRAAGHEVVVLSMPELMEAARLVAQARVIGAEAHALHRDRLARRGPDYDPLVRTRITAGAEVAPEGVAAALDALPGLRADLARRLDGIDAVISPTTPMQAPRLADLLDEPAYLATNIRAFSLTEWANRLDLPSISLPLPQLATGVMLTGHHEGDDGLLSVARAVLSALACRTENQGEPK